jgi:NADH-quinone oxidoreductase subunit A
MIKKSAPARFVLQATLRCDTPAAVRRAGVRFASDRRAWGRRVLTNRHAGASTPRRASQQRGRTEANPSSAWRVLFRTPTRAEACVPSLISDYLPLVVFIALGALISGALLIAPFLVAYKSPDPEKLSPYECGFNPFDDARMKFDVRFYLVSLLFIIFDLEVAFLFPWAIAFHDAGAFGFWSMMLFLAVLTIGFVYEWNKGALEWD